MIKNTPTKIYLDEREIPSYWLNVNAYLTEKHAPFLDPVTKKPIGKEELQKIFCKKLVEQELDNTNKFIEIPSKVLDFYAMYRPTPLTRAYYLEEVLGTPCEIYYKFEGNNTSGSHKLNSAIPQAYYAKEEGITTLTTETGAGQWGTALAMACSFYGLNLNVFMVKVSAEQKPFRRYLMETYGAKVTPSPSMTTEIGRQILRDFPTTPGSLGCAVSEAVEMSRSLENSKYVLGSVLDHVVLHQSIIGLECKKAFEKIDRYPDVIVGCAGGGSNLGGLIAPFVADKIEGVRSPEIIAVEPASCPSLTRGKFAYDYGDTGKITPLMKMYTLGCEYMPAPNHAGGLRYHGMNPLVSHLYNKGMLKARSVLQTEVFEAAVKFARCEGWLPAPESAHAIKVAIDEAEKCKKTGEKKVILLGLTGRGDYDLKAYKLYLDGTLSDYLPTDEEIYKSTSQLKENY